MWTKCHLEEKKCLSCQEQGLVELDFLCSSVSKLEPHLTCCNLAVAVNCTNFCVDDRFPKQECHSCQDSEMHSRPFVFLLFPICQSRQQPGSCDQLDLDLLPLFGDGGDFMSLSSPRSACWSASWEHGMAVVTRSG